MLSAKGGRCVCLWVLRLIKSQRVAYPFILTTGNGGILRVARPLFSPLVHPGRSFFGARLLGQPLGALRLGTRRGPPARAHLFGLVVRPHLEMRACESLASVQVLVAKVAKVKVTVLCGRDGVVSGGLWPMNGGCGGGGGGTSRQMTVSSRPVLRSGRGTIWRERRGRGVEG